MTKTYGGSYGRNTPLDNEPADIDRAVELQALEAEQDAREATVEAESDEHRVLRHTEFYPLEPASVGQQLTRGLMLPVGVANALARGGRR